MSKKLIIIGALAVLLIVAFVGGVAVFILKARQAAITQMQGAPAAATPTQGVATASTSASTAPFASLPESDIPGRYMVYGNEDYSLTLYADHTFRRMDGAINPRQSWYLTPEALVINWGGNEHRYDRIEGPGIYSCPKSIGGRRRMEKQPANPTPLRLERGFLLRSGEKVAEGRMRCGALIRTPTPR